MIDLNEVDLVARMKNFEDHLVERKVISDQKDWKKTAVAFANSVPVGLPAVLFIGVRDNGEIETPQPNLDDAQKKFNKYMQDVYPRVPYVPKIISDKGQQALAIIIPGSELRPHFAGLSYVRRGSESIEASEQQFDELITQRNSKAAKILAWKGKTITVDIPLPPNASNLEYRVTNKFNASVVTECTSFYVSLQPSPTEPPTSFSLSRVEILFDNLRQRLQLEIHQG
jgi:Putative DNA-binding domain